jgi:TonB family protein
LLLEQGRLVSSAASASMRAVFESPEIPHDPIKFVKGLEGRNVQLIRKWGSWENWLHDTAVVTSPERHYILVALTRHPRGDEYLAALAAAVDDAVGWDPLDIPAPDYPAAALRQKQEGTVQVRVKITGDLKVESMEVVQSSSHAALDSAALDAVRRGRWKPSDAGVRVARLTFNLR